MTAMEGPEPGGTAASPPHTPTANGQAPSPKPSPKPEANASALPAEGAAGGGDARGDHKGRRIVRPRAVSSAAAGAEVHPTRPHAHTHPGPGPGPGPAMGAGMGPHGGMAGLYGVGRGDIPPLHFANPPYGLVAPDQMLLMQHRLIRFQVEYYFSVENLCKDIFLRKNMDENGWVPIGLISSFNRIRRLTESEAVINDALRASVDVEVLGGKLRKRHNWEFWVLKADGTPRSGSTSPNGPTPSSPSHPTVPSLPTPNNGHPNPSPSLNPSLNGAVWAGGAVSQANPLDVAPEPAPVPSPARTPPQPLSQPPPSQQPPSQQPPSQQPTSSAGPAQQQMQPQPQPPGGKGRGAEGAAQGGVGAAQGSVGASKGGDAQAAAPPAKPLYAAVIASAPKKTGERPQAKRGAIAAKPPKEQPSPSVQDAEHGGRGGGGRGGGGRGGSGRGGGRGGGGRGGGRGRGRQRDDRPKAQGKPPRPATSHQPQQAQPSAGGDGGQGQGKGNAQPPPAQASNPPPSPAQASNPPPSPAQASNPPPSPAQASNPPPSPAQASNPPPSPAQASTPPPSSAQASNPPPSSAQVSNAQPPPAQASNPPPSPAQASTPQPPPVQAPAVGVAPQPSSGQPSGAPQAPASSLAPPQSHGAAFALNPLAEQFVSTSRVANQAPRARGKRPGKQGGRKAGAPQRAGKPKPSQSDASGEGGARREGEQVPTPAAPVSSPSSPSAPPPNPGGVEPARKRPLKITHHAPKTARPAAVQRPRHTPPPPAQLPGPCVATVSLPHQIVQLLHRPLVPLLWGAPRLSARSAALRANQTTKQEFLVWHLIALLAVGTVGVALYLKHFTDLVSSNRT